MSDERPSAQERTEQPTPRRREQAREEGRVARSAELGAAAVLLAGTAALGTVAGRALGESLTALMRSCGAALADGPFTPGAAAALLRMVALGAIGGLLPFAVVAMLAAVSVGFLQTRGVLSWQPVTPKWSHVSPLAGLRRIVSLEGVVNLLKAMAKVAALGVVTYLVLAASWPSLIALTGADSAGTAAVARSLAVRLAAITGLAFLVIAVLDFGFQRYRYERDLRMTRAEVVREYRETEGDPHVKARIQSLARSQARKRMLRQVPTADVVVVNPTHVAVALRYDPATSPAPVILAMGERKLAERIRQLALAAGVPVIQNVSVARALLAVGTVGRPIPPALYTAVAEILAFVYRRRMRGLRVGVTS